jgi:hypothetical protein
VTSGTGLGWTLVAAGPAGAFSLEVVGLEVAGLPVAASSREQLESKTSDNMKAQSKTILWVLSTMRYHATLLDDCWYIIPQSMDQHKRNSRAKTGPPLDSYDAVCYTGSIMQCVITWKEFEISHRRQQNGEIG